jgi:hypothetical protein
MLTRTARSGSTPSTTGSTLPTECPATAPTCGTAFSSPGPTIRRWSWLSSPGGARHAPVMAPGYVRYHPRILTAQLERSDWDGSLLAMVDLVTPQPAQLRYLRFDDDRGTWRDWPSETTFTGDRAWYEPGTDDLSRSPHLLVSASLRFTVPSGQLPQPPVLVSVLPGLAARELVEAARRSVAVLVRQLNAIIGPIIERIEEEG